MTIVVVGVCKEPFSICSVLRTGGPRRSTQQLLVFPLESHWVPKEQKILINVFPTSVGGDYLFGSEGPVPHELCGTLLTSRTTFLTRPFRGLNGSRTRRGKWVHFRRIWPKIPGKTVDCVTQVKYGRSLVPSLRSRRDTVDQGKVTEVRETLYVQTPSKD